MKASRFNEEQIIAILREHEAGAKTAEVCHGISDATFYKWKAKYGGMEASDAKRLKALEDENRRLKKLLSESMLDNGARSRTSLEKTAEACGSTVGSSPADRTARVQPMPRVQADRNRSFSLTLSEQASG